MKTPDIIYTDGMNTCATRPVFSNIDSNIKYIRADLAEQPETNLLEESYMRGFAQGAKDERERMLEDIIKMRDTAEQPAPTCKSCGFYENNCPFIRADVDLEREILKYKVPFADDREYLNETTLDAIARHFAQWQKGQMKPIRVAAAEDAWETDGTIYAPKLRIVDDEGIDAIVVPGFNVEFTLYKED